MTNESLARSYLTKARARLKALAVLRDEGDIDFVPTEQYSAGDAHRAYDEAAWVVKLAEDVIGRLPR